jgi:LysM repeat protein/ABC-type branched-subunit amino acid transport system substrate-binding protein
MPHTFLLMRYISIYYILFIIISAPVSLNAQNNTGEEKVMINGKKYILYMAVSGDSPVSIARKFGLTLSELTTANPEILEKMNSGSMIKIPVKESGNQPTSQNGLQKDNNDEGLFTYHPVWKRETVFSIARKHKVTIEDIYQYNPKSREGINEGDLLKIPKKGAALSETPDKPIDKQSTIKFSDKQPAAIQGNNPPTIKHIVGRKETLFSIAKQYDTSQQAILKLNPGLTGDLAKGTVLIIPDVSSPVIEQKEPIDLGYTEYQIVSGDTYFQLEKRFGVTKADLEQANPSLKDGLNTGMKIRIPSKNVIASDKIEIPVVQKNDESIYRPSEKVTPISLLDPGKTYNVGVFLPFCQNLNDSFKIAQRTAAFLEFYSGVLLATEKMSASGMKAKLFVYDTYQENSVIERLVKKPEFLSLDLIIGPVYPENQSIVAELSAKNHIPMISPLSSDNRFVSSTPDYYQINPVKILRLNRTADYISETFSDQNIILLSNGSGSGDEKQIIDRLNQKISTEKLQKCNIWTDGNGGLETMLKSDQENFIVLTEGREANVSVAMTRLNTASKAFRITVIGLQEYTKMQSINLEYLHNIRLRYLAPYFIEYGNPKVITFVEKYRNAFGGEPTQYSFQGYDVAFHFLASLGKFGKDFSKAEQVTGIELLQADYNFQKVSPLGGFLNQTLYVIEYTDSFEVKSLGKFQGKMVEAGK